MRLFKNWAKTFGENEDINPDSEMLVNNFKDFDLLIQNYKNAGKLESKFQKLGINIKDKCGGVEDPRYFIYNEKVYVLMNGLDNHKNRNM